MGLRLVGEVALDGSGFEKGIDRLKDGVKGFIVAAFGIYSVEEVLRKTFERADQLVTASQRLGVGVEQLQVLGQAAKEAGSDLDIVKKSFEKIDQARAQALSGSEAGMKKLAQFQRLGISEKDLQTKSAADLFMGPIRDAANSMNQEVLGPILKDVMGKSFGEAIPILKTDFEEMQAKMKKLGLIMDTETAVKLDNLGDEFSKLALIITTSLAPVIVQFAEWIMNVLTNGQGVISRALESIDFLVRRKSGDSELPGKTVNGQEYSAGQLHAQATSALDAALDAQKRGLSPAQFIAERNKALSMPAPMTGAQSPLFPALADDISKSWQEELKYLNSLIQPVEDVSNDASKKSGMDFQNLRDSIAEWKKNMAEEAEKLKHPKPATYEAEPTAEKEKKEKRLRTPEDALVKVGNFLGTGARSMMENIGMQQLELTRQIAANTNPNVVGAALAAALRELQTTGSNAYDTIDDRDFG